MRQGKTFASMALILALALGAAAQDKLAVAVEPHWTTWQQNGLDWDLGNYGVKTKHYLDTELLGGKPKLVGEGATKRMYSEGKTPGARAKEFADDLGKAQLLSFGWQVSDQLYLVPELRQAIDAFLARGGTIFYHYNSSPANIPALNSLGKRPTLLEPGIMLQGVAAAESKAQLLRQPNDLAKFAFSGAGAWPRWSDQQQTLIHKKGAPDAGLLLLFEGVSGKGNIVINRIHGISSDAPNRSAGAKALIENIIRHVWGNWKKAPCSPPRPAPPSRRPTPPTCRCPA